MQQFYRNVSSYTREVLIYSTMNPVFHKSPRQTIEQWERGNLDVELPEELLKVNSFLKFVHLNNNS